MFISLKKHLSGHDPETHNVFERMLHVLLQGVARHAISLDKEDLDGFQCEMTALDQQLGESPSNDDALLVTGAAIACIKDYSQKMTKSIRAQSMEFHSIVSLLTETVSRTSQGSDRSISKLQAIEKQIEQSQMVGDLRTLKGELAKCLISLREETARQKEASAQSTNTLVSKLNQVRQLKPVRGIDPLTGLQGRQEAEAEVTAAWTSGQPAYLCLFYVERLQSINARFGYAAGDKILLLFCQHLAQNLAANDQLFRWGAAAFVVLFIRDAPADEVRREIQRIAAIRLEQTMEIAGRNVLLPISSHWTLMPVVASEAPEVLIPKIDTFLAQIR